MLKELLAQNIAPAVMRTGDAMEITSSVGDVMPYKELRPAMINNTKSKEPCTHTAGRRIYSEYDGQIGGKTDKF